MESTAEIQNLFDNVKVEFTTNLCESECEEILSLCETVDDVKLILAELIERASQAGCEAIQEFTDCDKLEEFAFAHLPAIETDESKSVFNVEELNKIAKEFSDPAP